MARDWTVARRAVVAASLSGMALVLAHTAELSAEGGSLASAQSPLEQCEIYPLVVGARWLYQSGPLVVQERVARHEEVHGELCARVETMFDDRVVSFEHLAVRADGVYRVAISGTPIEPPLRLVALPVKSGDRWNVDSTVSGQRVRGELVTSEGTYARRHSGDADQKFKTHRIVGERFRIGSSEMTLEYEFVPRLGKVRQTAKTTGQETMLELREFSLPGQMPTRSASLLDGLFRR
jgi:hypothetical protein